MEDIAIWALVPVEGMKGVFEPVTWPIVDSEDVMWLSGISGEIKKAKARVLMPGGSTVVKTILVSERGGRFIDVEDV